MSITTLNTGVQKFPGFLAYLLQNKPHKSKCFSRTSKSLVLSRSSLY